MSMAAWLFSPATIPTAAPDSAGSIALSGRLPPGSERRPGSPFLSGWRQALVGPQRVGDILEEALGLDDGRPGWFLLLTLGLGARGKLLGPDPLLRAFGPAGSLQLLVRRHQN